MRRFFVVLALAFVVFLLPRDASACQCQPMPSVPAELARAEYVFVATAAGRVLRVFKGKPPAQVKFGQSDCPPDATAAKATMLFYGYEAAGQFIAEPCGRTRPLAEASADVAELTALTGSSGSPP